MSTNNTPFFPSIDETKIPPEVAVHLRLMYDRFQNHYQAIGNLQTKIDQMQTQIQTLQQAK